MSDDVAQKLRGLSISDAPDLAAEPPEPRHQHAVAGLELAVASLRELIGEARA